MGVNVIPETSSAEAADIDALFHEERDVSLWPAALRQEYAQAQSAKLMQEAPFYLTLGLLVCFATLLVDATVIPDLMVESATLRGLAVAPITLIGLIAAQQGRRMLTVFCICASFIAFGAVMVALTPQMPDVVAARILVAVALMPSLAGAVIPLSQRGLIALFAGFSLTYLTTLAATATGGLGAHADVIAVMVLSQAGIFHILQRHEYLRQRNFLLARKNRAATADLVDANRMLRYLSERDPLTSLPNRRHFEAAFESKFGLQADDHQGRIALMMIDLDHFKAFNDRHGHQAGDQCLQLVSREMARVLQGRDVTIARYGGEEFIAAMREREKGEASLLADTLCKAVAALPGRTADTPLITTSIGLAIAPSADCLPCEELIEMADAALYSAKKAGRNRIEMVEAGTASDTPTLAASPVTNSRELVD